MGEPFATPVVSPAKMFAFSVGLAVAGVLVNGVLLQDYTVGGEQLPAIVD